MPILPRLRGVLRSLAGRGPVQRDLDADISACLEMLVDEKMAAGMSPGEARRQARLELGGVEQVKEAVRAVRPAALLDTIGRDVRYSVRLLAKTPAFSFTAILVLAAGIGANTAAFGVINTLWFQPVPGAQAPGELVALYSQDPIRLDSYQTFSYADYEVVRGGATLFGRLMAHMPYQVGVTEGGISRRTSAEICTRSYFATLGVGLVAGRTFTPEEERPGSRAAVMVVSHVYWERLGSPPDILGRTILVNSHPFTVIGVAPAGFAGRMVLAGPEFWMPLGAAALFQEPRAQAASTSLAVMVVGRLKPGVTAAAANAGVRLLSGALPPRPDGTGRLLSVNTLSRFNQGNRPEDDEDEVIFAFGALQGAALIVLVIASLNVANMQLARGTSRRKEIAMRLALGAGRGRIVAQMLVEGL
ncbi:MAG TPA: ABC transporter permease, partial [Geminicoccaceae bacterium]|nr:ABC transporter permease [Geminicoccaceae bacterium]